MTLDRIISAAEVDFEKEYEEFQREGIDTHGPETGPEKGDELWFQIEAGLPRAGLDPEKDTTHISDEELLRMFGEKVPNKGYYYRNAAVKKVTSLAEELYMPIYQVDTLPEQFIPESFARALVSEVSHCMPMNWARYAEGVWGRKKGDAAEQRRHMATPTIKYNPTASQETYATKVLERVESKCREDFTKYRNASLELQLARDRVAELRDTQPTDEAYIDAKAAIDKEIILHNLSIDMARCNLHYAREFLQIVSEETDLNLLETYRKKEAEERKNLSDSKKKLEGAKLKMTQLDQPSAEAIRREKAMNTECETFKLKLEEDKEFIHHLRGNSYRILILRPSRFPVEGAEVEGNSIFCWMPCAFCGSPFPAKDVILAPCMCLYHPWCIVMQNLIPDSCAKVDCKRRFGEDWQKSLGLFNIQGNANFIDYIFSPVQNDCLQIQGMID
jgi:hypothetical protein